MSSSNSSDDDRKTECYVSPPGYHRHRCKFCAYVWEHHDSNDVRHGDAGAHECPGCRRCNWSLGIYDGEEPPSAKRTEWRRGPLPPGTWGWGGVVPSDFPDDPLSGFLFADFCGDHVKVVGSERVLKADEVRWYDNSLELPPRAKKKDEEG